MSEYTMMLREYIEHFSQTQTGLTTSQKIENGRPFLFDFDYPIYDTNYKKDFETHFIRYFYTREIGFETEGLFKFHLETWLNINMPYWNKMYESTLLTYDPLQNMSRSTDNSTTASGSSSSTDTNDGFDRRLFTDTPDNRLSIVDDDTNEVSYASEIEENKNNDTRTNSATGNSTTDTNITSSGKIGEQTYPELIQKHRQAFMNVDRQVFDQMQDLFMLIY